MSIKLVLKDGLKTIRVNIGNSPVFVGRSRSSDVKVTDKMVSARHCKIYFENDRVFVKNLNSTNGTYVNGNAVENHCLCYSDVITIGSIAIYFDKGSLSKKEILQHSGPNKKY